MKAAIHNLLTTDPTLIAILPGGVQQAIEITRQATPDAFDANNEIQPCALLKLSTDPPTGPHPYSSRLTFNLYFYQLSGYTAIEAARYRAYSLLHRQKTTPHHHHTSCWQILHSNDILYQEDQALRCSMAISRYQAYINRSN